MKTYRIDKMFRLLKDDGVRVRRNFSCCSNCAWSELGNAVPTVFYHQQDTERWKKTGDLYLRYDSHATGHKIIEAAEKAKVNVEWNKDPGTCIIVKGKRP